MFAREWHRGAHFQNIVVRTDATDQHAVLAHGIQQSAGLRRGGLLGGPVLDQFGGKEQALVTYIANDHVIILQRTQTRGDIGARANRVHQQVLVFRKIENR